MKKIILIYLATLMFFNINGYSQTLDVLDQSYSLSDADIDFNAPLIPCAGIAHYDDINLPKDGEKIKSHATGDVWARSLRFRAYFEDNCEYDHGNQNQLDWNKLLSLAPSGIASEYSSSRLGWRWNLTTNSMEFRFVWSHKTCQ